MALGWAYNCNLRAFVMLPGPNETLIDSDADVIAHASKAVYGFYRSHYERRLKAGWTNRTQ